MSLRRSYLPFACTLLAGAIHSQLAVAQGGFLEEIIVTAEKREESLQIGYILRNCLGTFHVQDRCQTVSLKSFFQKIG